jgi:hypothetical protein
VCRATLPKAVETARAVIKRDTTSIPNKMECCSYPLYRLRGARFSLHNILLCCHLETRSEGKNRATDAIMVDDGQERLKKVCEISANRGRNKKTIASYYMSNSDI